MKSSPIVVLSIVGVVMLALPAASQVPCGIGGGQIGPCPALIDSNGNGLPDPGVDEEINFGMVENMLTISSPWSSGPCGGNEIEMYGMYGPYDNARRYRPGENFQEIFISDFDNNEDPTSFGFYDSRNQSMGSGMLRDANGDFVYESLQLSAPLNLTLGFVGASLDGDGEPDYISVPWAQASLFGMNGSCALPGGDPQIWVPLDGDRIVPGFPGFYQSPRLAAAIAQQQGDAIPTLEGWGPSILVTLLAAIGWWFIRQQRLLG